MAVVQIHIPRSKSYAMHSQQLNNLNSCVSHLIIILSTYQTAPARPVDVMPANPYSSHLRVHDEEPLDARRIP
jgi:hypothetical protein